MKFDELSCVDALEVSLVQCDELTLRAAAGVAVARQLAARVDQLVPNGYLDDNGKLDNVTVSKYLECLRGLGLLGDLQAPKVKGARSVSSVADELARRRGVG